MAQRHAEQRQIETKRIEQKQIEEKQAEKKRRNRSWLSLVAIMSFTLLISVFTAGCSKKAEKSSDLDKFVGEWSCEDSYLEEADTYTGFYALSINDDGSFSLYDAEAGNPGIAGTMSIDSDSELTLDCEEEDFDPPALWLDMSQKQTLKYEFKSDKELHLIYTGKDGSATLVFHYEEDTEDDTE